MSIDRFEDTLEEEASQRKLLARIAVAAGPAVQILRRLAEEPASLEEIPRDARTPAKIGSEQRRRSVRRAPRIDRLLDLMKRSSLAPMLASAIAIALVGPMSSHRHMPSTDDEVRFRTTTPRQRDRYGEGLLWVESATPHPS